MTKKISKEAEIDRTKCMLYLPHHIRAYPYPGGHIAQISHVHQISSQYDYLRGHNIRGVASPRTRVVYPPIRAVSLIQRLAVRKEYFSSISHSPLKQSGGGARGVQSNLSAHNSSHSSSPCDTPSGGRPTKNSHRILAPNRGCRLSPGGRTLGRTSTPRPGGWYAPSPSRASTSAIPA